MNSSTIEKNWADLKIKIMSKWGKFNDKEVEGVKNDLSLLVGKIQKVYGIAKYHADRQYDEFRKSVREFIAHEADSETPDVSPTVKHSEVLPKPKLVITPRLAKTDPRGAKNTKVG